MKQTEQDSEGYKEIKDLTEKVKEKINWLPPLLERVGVPSGWFTGSWFTTFILITS